MKSPLGLVALALVVFAVTTYGGVRSPDSEVVYRTAEALASRGSFAVDQRLEPWPTFGLATGTDGALYSVFGPLQSVLLAPFAALGDAIAASGRYDDRQVPVSHYLGKGWANALRGEQPLDRAAHGARWPASWLNVLVGALCVWAFYRLLLTLTGQPPASLSGAALLGFGTPLWAYGGTFFTEPLATLLVVLSLHQLVRPYEAGGRARAPGRSAVASGLLLGLAVLTHISALLFAPFFVLYLVWIHRAEDSSGSSRRVVGAWLVAFGAALVLLGIYNSARFGSPFETGRTVDPALAIENGYGTFIWPGIGLLGLLFSPGKGLLLYVPVVAVGLALWPRFHRRHRVLSWTLASAVVFRLVAIASRSDWHGGLALGPRLLLMVVPVLILPLSVWLADEMERGRRRSVRLFAWLAFALVIQQLYLALGEVFGFLHARRFEAQAEGRPLDVVFDWANSPLLHSLDRGIGPYLLQPVPLSPVAIWLVGSLVAAVAMVLWRRRLLRSIGS